jgi:two-component sensor histidine kinase
MLGGAVPATRAGPMGPHDRDSARSPPPLAMCRLPPVASSAARARALARAALGERLPADSLHTIELLTCEVVTNALVHARTPCEVRLTEPERGVVRVEVFDEAGHRPPGIPAARDSTAPTGRGLGLVDALASDWGATVEPSGKKIWFEVDTRFSEGGAGRSPKPLYADEKRQTVGRRGT